MIPTYRHDLPAAKVAELLRGADRPVMLEVGANEGEDTEIFAAIPGVTLFCFEPDPRAARLWSQRMEAITLRDNVSVTLVERALADAPGKAMLHLSGGWPPDWPREPGQEWTKSSSLCRPTGHLTYSPWCKFTSHVEVEVTTLDLWAADWPAIGVVDFLWADVQGAEARLLAGGAEMLRRTRWVYLECHQRPLYEGQAGEDDLRERLAEFDLLARYGENLLFHNRVL